MEEHKLTYHRQQLLKVALIYLNNYILLCTLLLHLCKNKFTHVIQSQLLQTLFTQVGSTLLKTYQKLPQI